MIEKIMGAGKRKKIGWALLVMTSVPLAALFYYFTVFAPYAGSTANLPSLLSNSRSNYVPMKTPFVFSQLALGSPAIIPKPVELVSVPVSVVSGQPAVRQVVLPGAQTDSLAAAQDTYNPEVALKGLVLRKTREFTLELNGSPSRLPATLANISKIEKKKAAKNLKSRKSSKLAKAKSSSRPVAVQTSLPAKKIAKAQAPTQRQPSSTAFKRKSLANVGKGLTFSRQDSFGAIDRAASRASTESNSESSQRRQQRREAIADITEHASGVFEEE